MYWINHSAHHTPPHADAVTCPSSSSNSNASAYPQPTKTCSHLSNSQKPHRRPVSSVDCHNPAVGPKCHTPYNRRWCLEYRMLLRAGHGSHLDNGLTLLRTSLAHSEQQTRSQLGLSKLHRLEPSRASFALANSFFPCARRG